MKNKICIIAGVLSMGLSCGTSAHPLLNSSAIDIKLSTGNGMQKDYSMTISTAFVTDERNPSTVTVINNTPTGGQLITAGNTVSVHPALVLYTNKANPLQGTLNVTFTAAFNETDVFTKTYQLSVDGNGDLTDMDDLPAIQNGVVCEFVTVPAVAGTSNPQIDIQCQDYNS